ncbi:MAG TPA: transposase [Phycisphaerales bacterium]|nr:transposase [Phycisphaerales bacterium]
MHEKKFRRWERPLDMRFITFSAYDRRPLLKNARIMDLFVEHLIEARRRHGFKLYAWVVMPEHVHMIIRADGSAWSHVAQVLKTNTSKKVLARWREIGLEGLLAEISVRGRPRFWQHGGGFDRMIRDTDEFCREVRYIHENPVERGLVTVPQDWRWSSVHWWRRQPAVLECDWAPGGAERWGTWTGFVDAREEDTITKT